MSLIKTCFCLQLYSMPWNFKAPKIYMVLQKGLQPMVRKQASNNSSSPYTSWLLTPFLFLKSFFVLQKSGHSLQFTEILSPLSFNKSQILFRNWFLMFLCFFLISGKIIEELSPHFLPWKANCWKNESALEITTIFLNIKLIS